MSSIKPYRFHFVCVCVSIVKYSHFIYNDIIITKNNKSDIIINYSLDSIVAFYIYFRLTWPHYNDIDDREELINNSARI